MLESVSHYFSRKLQIMERIVTKKRDDFILVRTKKQGKGMHLLWKEMMELHLHRRKKL